MHRKTEEDFAKNGSLASTSTQLSPDASTFGMEVVVEMKTTIWAEKRVKRDAQIRVTRVRVKFS